MPDADHELDLLLGTLDVLILKTLSWGPSHGYGIARWIRDSSGETFRILDGALYTALHRLEERGAVEESEWGHTEQGKRAKFYRLTVAGRRELRTAAADWDRYAAGMAGVLSARPPSGLSAGARMAHVPKWRRYLRFWRTDVAADVDDELRFHFEARAEDLRARGVGEAEVTRTIAEEFGDVAQTRRELHAIGARVERRRDRQQWWHQLVADLRFAVRALRRAPGWTAVALLTIALGVGASTAVFSVADTFLVRPLAYRDASRVYAASLQGTLPTETIALGMPAAVVRTWRTTGHTVDAAATYGPRTGAALRGDAGGAEDDLDVAPAIVDRSFLPFTGARPLLGRNFTIDETAPNGPRAVMLAEGLWRRQFGASPDVVGRVVRLRVNLDTTVRPYTVVGVVPGSVVLPDFTEQKPDLWLPLVEDGSSEIRGVAVRLKRGVSPEAASAELTTLLEHAGGVDPEVRPLHPRVRLTRPQDALPFRQALRLLTGAVVLLLLIACSNVAHLLLQRGLTRERELATRHALGAARGRLVRQLVTESTLLGGVGGALAMLVGWGTLAGLAALRPASLPALSYLSTTRGVVPLAAGLSLAVGLGVGVLGALHVAHARLAESLRTGASSASPAHRRLRGALVIGQLALSTTLLAGALVLVRVVLDLKRVDVGFDPRGLYAVSFRERDPARVPSAAETAVLGSTIRDVGERQLGPGHLTLAATALDGMAFASELTRREQPDAVVAAGITGLNFVAPDYFTVLRMPLLAGRTFDAGSPARDEVIVSRALARQLGGEGNVGRVVGRQFRFRTQKPGRFEPWQTVIGVAPDVLANRLDRAAHPTLFRPFPPPVGDYIGTTLLVRRPGPDAGTVLRRFARSVRPDRVRGTVQRVDERVDRATAEPRFTMAVLVVFALCGVLLAAIGLFGVLSYTLARRTREIGVRITLGASRRRIVGMFVGDAIGQAALGTGLGLAGAAGVARLTQWSFYGVEHLDTSTCLVAAALMLLAALVACAGPLVRATRVNPAVALRAE